MTRSADARGLHAARGLTVVRRLAVLAIVVLAACSSTDSAASSTTPFTFAVHVVVAQAGLGCVGNAPVGKGSPLTIHDAAGTVIGTGTFNTSADAESCDFIAQVTIAHTSDFSVIDGNGKDLATVPAAKLSDGGTVTLDVDAYGGVTVR